MLDRLCKLGGGRGIHWRNFLFFQSIPYVRWIANIYKYIVNEAIRFIEITETIKMV